MDVESAVRPPAPDCPAAAFDGNRVTDGAGYFQHLLKSSCTVTSQPDWGSVRISLHRPADRPGAAAAVHIVSTSLAGSRAVH